jgi:DNA-binding NtrC family response regulator
LRARPSDIPLLAEHFLRRFTPKGQPPQSFSPEATAALVRYQ